jgi:hypothetical protein
MHSNNDGVGNVVGPYNMLLMMLAGCCMQILDFVRRGMNILFRIVTKNRFILKDNRFE